MTATFDINNFSPANILERSQLNADVAVSASPVVLELINNSQIAANDYIVIGALGAESSELKQPSAVAGAINVTVPSISRPHKRFEDITKLFGNQIVIYRAPNINGSQPADISFAAFANNTVAINIDKMQTRFTDPNGSSDYWYKFVYSNTTTGATTNIADSSAARGQGYGNYCSIESIRLEAGFGRAKFITDAMIDEERQAAQREIDGVLSGKYVVPFTDPINPIISNMTKRLAAGRLLMQQYGNQSTSYTKGEAMVKSVTNDDKTGTLDKLYGGGTVVTDGSGVSTAVNTDKTGFSGWPNASTASLDGEQSGGDFMFRASDIGGNRY